MGAGTEAERPALTQADASVSTIRPSCALVATADPGFASARAVPMLAEARLVRMHVGQRREAVDTRGRWAAVPGPSESDRGRPSLRSHADGHASSPSRTRPSPMRADAGLDGRPQLHQLRASGCRARIGPEWPYREALRASNSEPGTAIQWHESAGSAYAARASRAIKIVPMTIDQVTSAFRLEVQLHPELELPRAAHQ